MADLSFVKLLLLLDGVNVYFPLGAPTLLVGLRGVIDPYCKWLTFPEVVVSSLAKTWAVW